ncbi:MAG TPA: hypothetical protein VGJ57_06415 [Nitrospirales bacterium]|jgi:hypothetical protein
MKDYTVVTVGSRHTGKSSRWYVIGWRSLRERSTLAVCRTQSMAEGLRQDLMDRTQTYARLQ